MSTVSYWKLSYRSDVSGYPWLDVMFSDEKHAISSLQKFWGEEFDTLIVNDASPNHREWYKSRGWGVRNLMATLTRVEATLHGRTAKLEGSRPEYTEQVA